MSEERSGKVGQEGGPVAVPSTRTAGTSSEHEYPSLKSVAAGLISVYLAAFIISLYVNLPIGAVSFVLVIFAYHPQPIAKKEMPITEKIARLDPVGTIFFMAGTICLLLALQWGGSTYAWKNARIIVLFILTGILLVAWLFVESRNPGTAIVPPRISLQRTVLSAMINSFFIGGSFMTLIYYLPIWFQSIKGANPLKSGVMTIAMIVPQVIASVVGAKTVQVTGYYNPWIYAGSILTSIGSGLFITFTPTTAHPKWIGYQVIYGLGLGCGFQQGTLAVQNTLSGPDVNIGVSIIILSLTLSGSIFVSVGQTLFSNTLAHHLSNIYGIDAEAIVNAGATAIRDIVPASKLSEVLVAYNAGIVAVFKLNTILACLSMIGAIGIEWKSLKREKAIEDKTEKAEEGLGDKAITRVGPTDRDGVTPLVAPTMVSEGDDESELDKEEYEEKQSRN
ncbi:putative mfs multidrug [Phaeomoniella chlamydospora]|uniref:Putative mfs multidrug n=1 Tax=Phaeomoniella chlamydospora TaxID=158046 RepID=A0A0G2GLA9_PHACM|nr:putative mfs multidrug [Phaeomoniella chlamydospora]